MYTQEGHWRRWLAQQPVGTTVLDVASWPWTKGADGFWMSDRGWFSSYALAPYGPFVIRRPWWKRLLMGDR
jgi:hypothetical protein